METRWHALSKADLAGDSSVRKDVEEAIESWLPNYTTESGRITSYEDLLDRVDGMTLRNGERLDIGGSVDSPAYRALKALARQIASESA